MICKVCGFDCHGLIDPDKQICMECWEISRNEYDERVLLKTPRLYGLAADFIR